jgi:hypothetical protein
MFRSNFDGCVQGYLAHKKQRPPRTLPKAYAQGPRAVPGGVAISHEQGTLVPEKTFKMRRLPPCILIRGLAQISNVTLRLSVLQR